MSREERRKAQRLLESISTKAKKDMAEWLETLDSADPTVAEMKAWKAGYIAGINRYNNKDNK
jgi:hypothetical protein